MEDYERKLTPYKTCRWRKTFCHPQFNYVTLDVNDLLLSVVSSKAFLVPLMLSPRLYPPIVPTVIIKTRAWQKSVEN